MPIDESFAQEIAAAVDTIVEQAGEAIPDADSGNPAETDVGTAVGDGEGGDSPVSSGDAVAGDTAAVEGSGDGDGEAAPTPPAAAPVGISDSALTEAVQHGIPIEDARLFPNEASLSRAVQAVRASIEKFAPKPETAPVDTDPLAALPTLDKDQFEPEVVSMFDAIIGIVKQQQTQLQAMQSKTEQYNANAEAVRQQASTQEINTWFDGQVAKLGDDFKDVLGVGGTEALPPGSPQLVKRDEIANQAAILLAGYRASGVTDVSRDEVFAKASRIVLADDYLKLAERKVSNTLQKRSKQHIQRAGGNQSAKEDAGDPAAHAVAELRKKFPQLRG